MAKLTCANIDINDRCISDVHTRKIKKKISHHKIMEASKSFTFQIEYGMCVFWPKQ